MRVLTNMRFWQSRTWTAATTSIYPYHRLPLGRKPLSPLREALELFRLAPGFDVVVTMGARESLAYGLLCLLTGRSSRQVLTEVFVDDPWVRTPLWQYKLLLYRAVARRSIGILTNSSAEIATIADRFRIPSSRLAYVPMHTNIPEPCAQKTDEGFILSAGFTHRDYDCLIRAASDIPARIVILCGANERLPDTLPQNIEVRRDRPRDEYLDLLRRCTFVALPLKPAPRATGQVVLLEAMALGKTVVAARAPGVMDYVRHGENGLLFDAGDAAALASHCRDLLGDPARASVLAHAALADILKSNTIETHAENKLRMIQRLWEAADGPRAAGSP